MWQWATAVLAFLDRLDPLTQTMTAVGTVGLGVMAYRLSIQEARRSRQKELDDIMEVYWIPVRRAIGQLRRAHFDAVGPGTLAGALAKPLDELKALEGKIGPAMRTGPKAVDAILPLTIMGWQLVGHLQQLAAKLDRMADNVASQVFSDNNRREEPLITLPTDQPGSQIVLDRQSQIDVALRRVRLSDWLMMRDYPKGILDRATVNHGRSSTSKSGRAPAEQVIKLWYSELVAAGFGKLGDELNDYRLLIEEAEKEVGKLLASHLRTTRGERQKPESRQA